MYSTNGAWPEWIATIGAPSVGAEYYQQCIYRPRPNCEMRALSQPFCEVCNQKYALTYFGHFRVNPTAPIKDKSPATRVILVAGKRLSGDQMREVSACGADELLIAPMTADELHDVIAIQLGEPRPGTEAFAVAMGQQIPFDENGNLFGDALTVVIVVGSTTGSPPTAAATATP